MTSFYAGEWLAFVSGGRATILKAINNGIAAGVYTLAFTTIAYFLFILISYGSLLFTTKVDYSTQSIVWFVSTVVGEISLFYIAIVPFSILGSLVFDRLFLADPKNNRDGLQMYLVVTLLAILLISVVPLAQALLG